jgi:hypothetical protein
MTKRVLTFVAMVVVALVIGETIALACGDKFVLLGMGSRVARSKYPSTILIYMNPASRVPSADKEFHVEAVLKAAGHKAKVAESQGEVEKALASGKYDLVLADYNDVPALRKEASSMPSKPIVLPLLYKPTPAELSAAEKEAECLVKPSKASRDLLVVVDQTLAERRKGVGAICDGAAAGN